MIAKRPILIIEDSDEDFEVICWALQKSGVLQPIIRASRYEEALSQLNLLEVAAVVPDIRPCLVLLDLNLPGMNGRELLARLQASSFAGLTPVVTLTTSNNPRDVEACYRLGASGYICKPLQLEAFAEKIKNLANYWFSTVEQPE